MKILIVGDSFTYGQGCNDRVHYYDSKINTWVGSNHDWNGPSQFCWPSLLQQRFPDIVVVNLARAGIDNTSILQEILNSCHSAKFDLIIFAGTYCNRKQIAHPVRSEWITSWSPGWTNPNDSPEYVNAKECYNKYLSNSEIDINLTVSAIMAAYGQSRVQDSKFLWSRPEDDISIKYLDTLKSHQIASIQHFDFSKVQDPQFNQTFVGPDMHIIDHGHQLYLEMQIIPVLRQLNIIV
jgi:hypothetical protein